MSEFIEKQIEALEIDNPDDFYASSYLRALKALKLAEEALIVAQQALHKKPICQGVVKSALAAFDALGK